MTTFVLIACSILVTIALAWRFRRRLARCIPNPVKAVCLLGSFIVLACLGLLLDVVCLTSLVVAIGQHRLLAIVLAAMLLTCIGCSKPEEAPKPNQVHWSAPDTGFQAETGANTLPPDKTGKPTKEP